MVSRPDEFPYKLLITIILMTHFVHFLNSLFDIEADTLRWCTHRHPILFLLRCPSRRNSPINFTEEIGRLSTLY